MADLIDTRNFRKGAVTMLKNGASIDKNLKRTLGTSRLKSVNSLSMPIYPDTVSSPFTGEAATVSSHTLLSLSTELNGIPATVEDAQKPRNQVTKVNSSYIRRNQENQIKVFAEKCWEEFQKRAVNPYKIPLEMREYEFPSKYINEAIKSLVDFSLLPTQKNNLLVVVHEENEQFITWKAFKKIMFSSFSIPFGPYEPQPEPQTLASSYSQLVEKQEIASNTALNEVATALEVEQVAAAVRLKGKMVPLRYLKDAFVCVVTDDVRVAATLDQAEQEKSVSTRSFTRSYSDSVSSVNSANLSTVNPRNPLGENLSAPLQKQTVLELVDPSQEYSQKWLHMKKLRDERVRRETSKRLRFEVLNAFSRIVLNATREETEESLARSNYEHESKVFSLSQNSHEMIQSCKDNTRFQYSKTVDRKKMEYKYMKKTLSNSTATFRSILYEENEMRKFKRDHTITELDPCTSTRVEIPASLTEKLKSAKSQKEYTNAQMAIQRYYERTLSERIATYTYDKQQHPSQADASFGIPLITRVQPSVMSFSDSLSKDDDFSKLSSTDELETISKTIRNNLANSPPQRMLPTMTYAGPSLQSSSSSFHSADVPRIMEEKDMRRDAAVIAWKNSRTAKNFRFKSPNSVVIR